MRICIVPPRLWHAVGLGGASQVTESTLALFAAALSQLVKSSKFPQLLRYSGTLL